MKIGTKALSAILLLIALVLANYIAANLPLRVDATANRIYTVSKGTEAILSKIEDPITLDFYFSRDTKALPTSYKNYAARIEAMLRLYVRKSKGRLILNVINPAPDSTEEEKALSAGLRQQMLRSGEKFILGLVATQADQQREIKVFDPQRESFLEYDLSELIFNVQQVDKKKLGLISSLPLQAKPDYAAMQQGRMPQNQYVYTAWQNAFDVEPIADTADSLPADLDVLAIVHPRNLPPKLLYAIDQYILSGRPVFIAVDPSSQYFKQQAGQSAMFGGQPDASSDLAPLFKAYGIQYDRSQVVGDLLNASQVQTADGSVTSYPVWLSLTKANLSADSLATAQLSSLLFVEPGSLSLAPGSKLDFTPLARSSSQAGLVPSMTLQFAQPEDMARQLKVSGPKTIAALITGKLRTAFPNGAPADAKAGVRKPTGASTPPELMESKGSATIIVVADTDWLLDDFSVRRFNFLGTQTAEPLNDNLYFAENCLEYLGGSEDLISIRGKGNSVRRFTVVLKMEAEAQQKYREQLDRVEARLAGLQKKLTELQGKRTENRTLLATPEMQKAIDEFQKQEADARVERRRIRRALRENIDSLEYSLLFANLLASPVFVLAVGLWYYRHRRS